MIKSDLYKIAMASACLATCAWAQAEPLVPADSAMATSGSDTYQRLLAPLTSPAGVRPGAWRIDGVSATAVSDPAPKLGATAVRFSGQSQGGGAKGDVPVAKGPEARVRHLGVWAYTAADSNVDRVGVQVVDAEGELLLVTQPADRDGWQWVEFDLDSAAFTPAYDQPERNGLVDQPLKQVNVVWFTESAGPTSLTVNALIATTDQPPAQVARLTAPEPAAPGERAEAVLVLHNPAATPTQYTVEHRWQQDGELTPIDLPDPVLGTDHAAGAESWTEHDGEEVGRGTLTDTQMGTSYKLPWRGGYTELTQYVDLGQVRPITTLGYESGDQNWSWKLDIASSTDGKTWQPVPGLTGLDVHQMWGSGRWSLDTPVEARHLRLRYHKDGEPVKTIAALSRLSVYDGVADEQWRLPDVGPSVGGGTVQATVPPRGLAVVRMSPESALPTGAYLCAVRVDGGETTAVLAERVYVMPEPMTADQQRRARIGLNSSTLSYAPTHRKLGIGWVRFENMKWQMASPEPGVFKFDGVGPWYVMHDQYFQTMRDHNIQTLPYLFEVPRWQSTAPQENAKRFSHYPPKDFEAYGEFVFQVVARYGSKSHPADVLKSTDKKSGMGLLTTYELWNEPNLNDPSWGHWIGTLPQYYEMFRVGAEAAKRADPEARVANAGFAGIGLDLVDQLRSYTYDDGKSPLDYIDVLSVHTYTGAVAPEKATIDTNRNRGADAASNISHEEQLRQLAAWRDEHRPQMPIWLTETGYDTGGPRGVSERLQAAYNVRNCLLMLAAGIDKVFIFREVGDRPSLYAASGLQRGDKTFKPSWFAVATLLRQLDNAQNVRRIPHEDDAIYLIGWQVEGAWTVAAWSIDGARELGLDLGAATVTDAFGATRSGVHTAGVKLGELPIYLTDLANPATLAALE